MYVHSSRRCDAHIPPAVAATRASSGFYEGRYVAWGVLSVIWTDPLQTVYAIRRYDYYVGTP